MKKEEIKRYIESQLSQIRSEKIADATEVMEYLTSVMRGECKEQVLRLVGDGIQEIDTINVSVKDRIKASELLGKRYGIFKENVSVDIPKVVIIDDIPEENEET